MKHHLPPRLVRFPSAAMALTVCLAALVTRADYVQITPAAAYAYSTFSGRGAAKAIDGSGLVNGLHDDSAGNMWMANGGNGKDGWFLVDFGSEQPLGSLKIWNGNQSGYANRGVKDVVLFVSTETDPRVNDAPDFTDDATWTEVQSIQVPQATGAAGYAGEAPLKLSVPVQARWVGFRIDEGWGGGYASISELQFFKAPTHTLDLSGITAATTSSVTFAGHLNSLDGTPGRVGIVYGATDGGEDFSAWDNVSWIGLIAPGDFTATLTDLAADMAYCAALVVENGDDYAFSAMTSFLTCALSVSVPNPFYENDPGRKSVVFSRPASSSGQALDVQYTLTGDAAADYASELPGSVTFPAGEASVSVTFTPVNDTATTGNRTVTVAISPSFSYRTDATSTATFTVLDDESAPAAVTYSWSGEGNNLSWETAANWLPNGVPNLLDTAVIDSLSSTNAPVLSSHDGSAYRLRVGYESGTVGALAIAPGHNFTVRSETSIGRAGLGALTVGKGADFLSANTPATLGDTATGIGTATVDGAFRITNGKDLTIGNAGTGELVIGPNGNVNVAINGQSGQSYIGKAATGIGTVHVNGGYYYVGYLGSIGHSGIGYLYINGGTVISPAKYGLRTGGDATGVGFVEIRSGGEFTCAASSYNQIGYGGSGTVHVIDGSVKGRGISIGELTGSTGLLIVEEKGRFDTGTTGYNLYVGKSGNGTLRLRGGSGTFSKNGHLIVRDAAAASGLIDGWGTISCSAGGGQIVNNGVVRANGYGEERALVLTSPVATFGNTIENDATNGWYAVDKGVLRLSNGATVAVGATGVYTWGEDENDAELDLVNSARIGFANVTAKVSSLEGRLYAPDHGDVPAFSADQKVLGVWKFSANGAFASFDLEIRYDDAAAERNRVQLYRYDETSQKWNLLKTTELDGHRLLANDLEPQGADKIGFFRATASSYATMLLIQ